jgi:hypothetical protein
MKRFWLGLFDRLFTEEITRGRKPSAGYGLDCVGIKIAARND